MIMLNSENILEVKNLAVSFDGNKVIENINFSLKRGEVLAVIGPNGAGKSVLLKTLIGIFPYSGVITVRNEVKVGYVPQRISIEPELPLTVAEFFKLKNSRTNREKTAEVLFHVGIEDSAAILNKRMGLLSGGQLQRVLIAWALLDSPQLLLFDEPTSGIDLGGEQTIYNLLRHLQTERNLAVILVSHDLNIVYRYADNVICLNERQVCFGQPNLVLDPASLSRLYGGEAEFYHHSHK